MHSISQTNDQQSREAVRALKPVVVTRAEAADGPLSSQLRALGLRVLLWPAVSVAAAETGPLETALRSIEQFDWVVFASRYAVAAVTEQVGKAPAGVRIAAVGRATAQVLRQRGWPVNLVPDEANAAALVAAFAALDARAEEAKSGVFAARGARILFPASSRALPTIAAGLSQLGASVVQVEAYRTESATLDVEECRGWIGRDAVGAVTFASPSAVVELDLLLGAEHFARLLSNAPAVAIGPTTARALAERGRAPAVAEAATLRGLALTTFRILQTRQ